MFVVLGRSCVIDCSADGSPTPRIAWKKSIAASGVGGGGDAPVEAEHPSEFRDILSSYRHQVYANGTFVLQEADKSDAGFYMCQVLHSFLSIIFLLSVNFICIPLSLRLLYATFKIHLFYRFTAMSFLHAFSACLFCVSFTAFLLLQIFWCSILFFLILLITEL